MNLNIPRCFLCAVACALPAQVGAVESDFALKMRLGGLHIDEPFGGSLDNEQRDEVFADTYASLLTQLTQNWRSYARVQGFWSTDNVFVNDEQSRTVAKSFGAVRELWIAYQGFTTYPGESIRIGRQRMQITDGLWADRDATAIQWLFATTLLQGRLAITEVLTDARSDNPGIDDELHRQMFAVGEIDWAYSNEHRAQVRVVSTMDRGDSDGLLPEVEGATLDRDATWLGVGLHNKYFVYRQSPQLAYSLQWIGQFGEQTQLTPAGATFQRENQDINAYAANVLLRWIPVEQAPLRLGLGYAVGSGGERNSETRQFSQTGLHSNRSRFTGTRSKLYRYNEAYRPNLTNVQVLTAFIAVQMDRADLSLIVHQFDRGDSDSAIDSQGLSRAPTTADTDLGHGFDVIAAYYFDQLNRLPMADEDTSANIRLRGSMFETGPAYRGVPDIARAVLELTAYF